MSNPARSSGRLSEQEGKTQDILSHEAQLSAEQSDNNSWQTVHFPGTIAVDQLSGPTPHLRTNAMDSSSNHQSNSTSNSSTSSRQASTIEQPSQREAELLNLVRDLNECNDVLLVKVSQLEESLERSQAALQAEIDRAGPPVGDREIVQLVTELEQSNQSLQHYQLRSETLQTEFNALQERNTQLETEHTALLRQHTEQSQELLQSNTNCRDLRARLQRQQRYTLQFKAALEKCLTMSNESSHDAMAVDAAAMAMPKIEQIRPWESALGHGKLDPQLESMIRGVHGTQSAPVTALDHEAEDQLWHDLARVMDPLDPAEQPRPESEVQVGPTQDISLLDDGGDGRLDSILDHSVSQFTEPSPWGNDLSLSTPGRVTVNAPDVSPDVSGDTSGDGSSSAQQQGENPVESPGVPTQLSPQASEILTRLQANKTVTATDTYLPAMSVQSSPSPLVNPLKPQKRKGSLAAIDLPSFPRLKQPSSQAKV